MNAATLAKLMKLLLELVTLNIIPKGYLTQAAVILQVVAGVGMLANTALSAISSGDMPNSMTMQDAFGLILLGNGASTMGVARKIETAAPPPPP